MTPETRAFIPFNRANVFGNEARYVAEAIASGRIASDGPFSARCVELLEEALEGPRVLLTHSCTQALEMSARLLNLEHGDEVLVPAFTFVSSASAFTLCGARPVFVDVRDDTLNIDLEDVARKITPRTRAVVALHYAGVACEIEELGRLCKERGLALVEDNAHGAFGRFRGRCLGTFGTFGALSFHEAKNISCGEGGALLVNDDTYFERAQVLRHKGTNRAKFIQGLVDKYTWVDQGSSYALSDLSAAFLLGQLEERATIARDLGRLWSRYDEELTAWAEREGAHRPTVPPNRESAHHLYHLVLPSREARNQLLNHLREQEIGAVFHYPPLHLSEMGRGFGGRPGDCPVAEDVSERLIRLPLFAGMEPDSQGRVIDAVRDFHGE